MATWISESSTVPDTDLDDRGAAVDESAMARVGDIVHGGDSTTQTGSRTKVHRSGSLTALDRNAHGQRADRRQGMLNAGARSGTGRVEEETLAMPDWAWIFDPGGNVRDMLNAKGRSGSNGVPDFVDLYDGVEAEFIQETLSNGRAIDSSALLRGGRLSDEVIFNGPVRASHDLGNAYVLATVGGDGHLRLYAGVERLLSDSGTYIEFEFNQNRVQLGAGAPWPIVGERTPGDLMVRMIFSNRTLQSVEFEEWQSDGFRFVDSGPGISGTACYDRSEFLYCVGPPPIQHPLEGFEAWNEDNEPIDPVYPDDFVEIGIDVDRLVGKNTDYSSILFRTPEDIAMNSFRVFDPEARIGLAANRSTSVTAAGQR